MNNFQNPKQINNQTKKILKEKKTNKINKINKIKKIKKFLPYLNFYFFQFLEQYPSLLLCLYKNLIFTLKIQNQNLEALKKFEQILLPVLNRI